MGQDLKELGDWLCWDNHFYNQSICICPENGEIHWELSREFRSPYTAERKSYAASCVQAHMKHLAPRHLRPPTRTSKEWEWRQKKLASNEKYLLVKSTAHFPSCMQKCMKGIVINRGYLSVIREDCDPNPQIHRGCTIIYSHWNPECTHILHRNGQIGHDNILSIPNYRAYLTIRCTIQISQNRTDLTHLTISHRRPLWNVDLYSRKIIWNVLLLNMAVTQLWKEITVTRWFKKKKKSLPAVDF